MFTVQSLFLETWAFPQCEIISLFQFQSNCFITAIQVHGKFLLQNEAMHVEMYFIQSFIHIALK